MSLLDYNEIPGFAEAANAEQVNREMAFFAAPLPILGVPIRHLNARHHMMLSGCGNRFLCGGMPRPEDVAGFLWFLSPDYSTDAGKREAFVKAGVAKLKFADAVVAIIAYREMVFQDWHNEGGGGKQFTAPVAAIVDILASEYGWTDEAILEMPLARIFQYLRRIQVRHNPKALLFNRSEQLIGKYLRDRMAAPPTDSAN